MSGRYGWNPREVSANRLATLMVITALIAALLVVWSAVDLAKQVRIDRMSKRITQGLCPYCRYALGDTTGTATCPECGKRNSLPVKRKK